LLERCLDEIVRRHEILRTRFEWVGAEPVQRIGAVRRPPLTVIDLRQRPAPESEEEANRLLQEQARQPFDDASGPLLRVILLRMGEQESLLALSFHRGIFDERSRGVLLQELAEVYEALSEGRTPSLAELPIQYAEFALWQAQRLGTGRLEKQLAYWKRRLADAPSALELPLSRARPSSPSHQFGRVGSTWSASLAAALRELGRAEGTTLFVTLLAALKTVLFRYSGQPDILVGTPTEGRVLRGTEELIGPFTNTLLLRTDLSGDPTFRQLLGRVHQTVSEADAHQDIPFERMIAALRTEANRGTPPLVQVHFALRDSPRARVRAKHLLIGHHDLISTINCDLNIKVNHRDHGLECVLEYSTDLFEAATIERMLGHLGTLLKTVAVDPDQRISRLPILTEDERSRMLVAWNDTATDYPRDACFHDLFAIQAERTPEAIAVSYEGQELTYDQLNRRANQLAHSLRARGIGPDQSVGICMERSPEMMVGLLGILKAGGAFVPLDPNYPRERLAWILADARLPVVLAEQRLLERLPEHTARVICVDRDWSEIARAPETNPESGATAEHLAYIIYTSGSTGKPKGTLIVHRGLVNYLTWAVDAYEIAAGRGAPVHSSLSFDLTITGLFAPLLAGRQVHLLREGPGVTYLSKALREESDYSLVKITPAHLQVLNHHLAAHGVADRTRRFVIGGEQLLGESLSFWQESAPNTVLVNEYGPTETVVGCCVYQIPREERRSGAVPIGRPIANTQLYILDRHMQPVPVGVAGELYIGGDGVARGYLNRPNLTAERFIPDPFSGGKGARLYKTGDLARYRPDGTVEYLGRLDHQVKIRGYRVEVEEIEVVISHHQAVRQAVVLARQDHPGEKRLVAYVVPQPGQLLTTDDLQRFMEERLPEYMVPRSILVLDALPLTSNGKVDRQGLPAPGRIGDEFIAPRIRTEMIVADLWSQILGLERVSVHDNFFELGGDSLSAAQLSAHFEKRLGLALPPTVLLKAPTIETLAQLIDHRSDAFSSTISLVELQPGGTPPPFFCVHPVGGEVLCFVDLARHWTHDQPFVGIRAGRPRGAEKPFSRIEDIAAHYVEEIRSIQSDGPYSLGGYSFGAIVAFEMARQLQARGQEIVLLAILDQTPAPDRSRPDRIKPKHIYSFINNWILFLLNACRTHGSGTKAKVGRILRNPKAALRGSLTSATKFLNNMYKKYIKMSNSDYNHTETPLQFRKVSEINRQALDDYAPSAYSGRITLFRARTQPLSRFHEDDLGWSRYAAGGVEIVVVPGNHDSLLDEPHVQVLAERLGTCCRNVRSGNRGVDR
jgi:amino acid adenylation domain-containing protein